MTGATRTLTDPANAIVQETDVDQETVMEQNAVPRIVDVEEAGRETTETDETILVTVIVSGGVGMIAGIEGTVRNQV